MFGSEAGSILLESHNPKTIFMNTKQCVFFKNQLNLSILAKCLICGSCINELEQRNVDDLLRLRTGSRLSVAGIDSCSSPKSALLPANIKCQ